MSHDGSVISLHHTCMSNARWFSSTGPMSGCPAIIHQCEIELSLYSVDEIFQQSYVDVRSNQCLISSARPMSLPASAFNNTALLPFLGLVLDDMLPMLPHARPPLTHMLSRPLFKFSFVHSQPFMITPSHSEISSLLVCS